MKTFVLCFLHHYANEDFATLSFKLKSSIAFGRETISTPKIFLICIIYDIPHEKTMKFLDNLMSRKKHARYTE